MSRFRDELGVIPKTARVTAWILSAVVAVAAAGVVWKNHPLLAWVFVPAGVLVGLLSAVYVMLVGYVYGDAKRRGMRYVVWTLMAIFVPNALGILLYFLLREPLQRACPSCGVQGRTGAAYCSACGAPIVRVCAQCNRPVEEGWRNCAGCGVALPG